MQGAAVRTARAAARIGRSRRRGRGLAVAALAFVLVVAGPAAGAELVRADPWRIIHVARGFGPAEVGRDGMEDPEIRGTLDELPYRIAFYGCRLGRDCDTILFEARLWRKEWDEKAPRAKRFAEWNRGKLVGRAWRDDEGRAVLDWPVTLAAGVPEATLGAAFERWRTALGEFAEHFDIR